MEGKDTIVNKSSNNEKEASINQSANKEKETTKDQTINTQKADTQSAQVTNNENTAPVYEDYEADEIAPKPKKKFKKRYIVLGLAVLVGGYMVWSGIRGPKQQIIEVETQAAALGSIENILSVSGTVRSAESKSYFSDVTAPIAEVNVKVGDKIAAGEILYSYDTDALNLSKQTAELAIKQAESGYKAIYDKSPTVTEELRYGQGMTAAQIQDRLDAIDVEIENIQHLKEEKQNRIQQTLNDLDKVLMDYNENGVSDSAEGYRATDRKDDDGEELYLQTQEAKIDVAYAKTNDPEIIAWDRQIEDLSDEKAHLTSAKSAQGSTYVNPDNAASTKAQMESTTLNQEDTIAKLEKAMEGVKADFNAVVTGVDIVEGGTVTAGGRTITLESTDNVEVSVQISKSDLPKIALGQQVDITIGGKEYSGSISKISGTATKNTNGVAVVDTTITISNPDSDIILGIEASNKIHAQKADNTLVLPYEYVQTDSEGDYVLIVDNGLVKRKNVTIGIASSTQAQIIDGLEVGDEIITGNYDELAEGTAVQIKEETSSEDMNQ
ncbi:efflux RND transporter periplasmic adaptor subunit [Butyrivibrio sp. MC2013]|uniref:efflux RND transporter periplasmic adaptor subunit n=1 Tax=Butyrivibrio sp. MC2013 TaxID=1280686 RepID=UPI00041D45CC|nr:efflux RND transporter periplasmic adaptor subunit [Butyrivibrio sp. MC2013]